MTREKIKKSMRDTKREVVLKNLHKLLVLVEGYPEYQDCISYAIETLEQPTQEIFNKIRTEIACNIVEDDTNAPARLRADWAAANKAHRLDMAILDKYLQN